jgi:hypothetical protein
LKAKLDEAIAVAEDLIEERGAPSEVLVSREDLKAHIEIRLVWVDLEFPIEVPFERLLDVLNLTNKLNFQVHACD